MQTILSTIFRRRLKVYHRKKSSSTNLLCIRSSSLVLQLTNPFNRSKLAERGEPGIFMGMDHNSKGYRIFTCGKIRVERHVKFLNDDKIIEHADVDLLTNYDDNNHNQSLVQTQAEIDQVIEPRRSERIRLQQANMVSSKTKWVPRTYNQAISCRDQNHWIIAIEMELRSIKENNTWTVVDLPNGKSAIGCKWLFKIKENENGTSTYKARLGFFGFFGFSGF